MRIKRTLYFLLFFIQFTDIFGQDISSYFLDSLKFVINKDTLINSSRTKLYFFKNTKDTQLVVFKNPIYKLVITFKFYDTGTYLVQGGWPEVYKNGIRIGLGQHHFPGDTNMCDMISGSVTLKNSSYMDSLTERFFVKADFRYTFLAPKDTSNYKYSFRQGNWHGRYKLSKKALSAIINVNYINDLKNGPVTIEWSDNGSYTVNYENGKKLNEGSFNLENVKRKRYNKRLIPEILYIECNK